MKGLANVGCDWQLVFAIGPIRSRHRLPEIQYFSCVAARSLAFFKISFGFPGAQ